MVDDAPTPRRPLLALGIAILVVVAAAAWAVTGWQSRDGASDDLHRAESVLESTRLASARVHSRLTEATRSFEWLQTQAQVLAQSRTVAQLDQQELDSIQRALDAGSAGDIAAYNRTVATRNALDAPHDAATQALRQAIDSLNRQLATW